VDLAFAEQQLARVLPEQSLLGGFFLEKFPGYAPLLLPLLVAGFQEQTHDQTVAPREFVSEQTLYALIHDFVSQEYLLVQMSGLAEIVQVILGVAAAQE
jgi:hypothetical protein